MSFITGTMITMKVCRCCGRERALDEFRRKPEMADGYLKDCQECLRRIAKERYERSKTTVRIKPSKKTCRRCNTERKLTEFYGHADARDGRQNICIPCKRTQRQEYRKANLIKCRISQENANKKNPERVRKNNADFYLRNPTARGMAATRRKARENSCDIREVTEKQWQQVVKLHRGICVYCKVRPYEHQDHVIPLSRGGRHAIGNLLPACAFCNLSKKDRFISEWKLRSLKVQRYLEENIK